jgi:hypothetical protein
VQGRAEIHTLVLWGATLPPDLGLAAARNRLANARLKLVIGRTDQYISADALARERHRIAIASIPFEVIEYDAGHTIKRPVLADLAARIAAT